MAPCSAACRARFRIRKVNEHQRQRDSGEKEKQRDASALRSRIEIRLRRKLQIPAPPGDIHTDCAAETPSRAGVGRPLGRVQQVRRGRRAIVNPHIKCALLLLSNHFAHQIVGAKRTVNESLQTGAPLCFAGGDLTFTIHGDVNQKASLMRGLKLLD